jgi:uncharacterized protein YjbI with pentapeptide repeats
MKTIKPQRLGLLTRPFEHKRTFHFSVSPLVFFTLAEHPTLLTEMELWKCIAEQLGGDGSIDEGIPKSRGEVIVHGRAFAPGAVPVTALRVRVTIGSVDKTLAVVGDRRWQLDAMSSPEPFTVMPLTWDRAFGGEGFAPNPIGKGFASIQKDGVSVWPLPNLEHPDRLIRTRRQQPAPAAFGPIDRLWSPRAERAGTYDQQWLEHSFPGFPDDIDWRHFNLAQDDQHLEGFFRGDEAFVLEHLHPDHPTLRGRLPGVTTRVFVATPSTENGALVEVPTRLDTVWFFPEVLRGVLIFRAVTRVLEDDATDVTHLLLACERLGEPKPREHYDTVLAQRLDRKRSHLFALRDGDLMPSRAPGEPASEIPIDHTVPEMEGLLRRNMLRRAERELARVRTQLAELGVNPDQFGVPVALPPLAPEPDLDKLPETIEEAEKLSEQLQAEAARRREEAEAQARALFQQNGLDYDEVLRKGRDESAGPPKFAARTEVERVRALVQHIRDLGGTPPPPLLAMLTPEFEEKLRQAERAMLSGYRRTAHHFPPASRATGDRAAALRQRALDLLARDQPFADVDLTGADLRGLDLSRADLGDALLEAADLSGCDLHGCNLQGAVLTRADLTGARLDGACLTHANLGRARLREASLRGADLSHATLYGADLTGTSLHRARLDHTDLTEALFDRTDLSNVTASDLNLLQSTLRGISFARATITRCNFLEVDLCEADFTGATLTATVFVTVRAEGARFLDAQLENLRVVHESSLARSDLRGARLDRANLRDTDLTGCDFSTASLRGADLSGCKLRGARLYRVVAPESRWVKADLTDAVFTAANLLQAILQKAIVQGTDFTGANLVRSDLARVRGRVKSLTDATLTQARIFPRHVDATP